MLRRVNVGSGSATENGLITTTDWQDIQPGVGQDPLRDGLQYNAETGGFGLETRRTPGEESHIVSDVRPERPA